MVTSALMVAVYTIAVFFFVLILAYPLAAALLALCIWLKKLRARSAERPEAALDKLDEQADKLKSRLFIILTVVIFFVVAPFLALLMIFKMR
jgi:hypothetical protein